jgi:hypothetical protein
MAAYGCRRSLTQLAICLLDIHDPVMEARTASLPELDAHRIEAVAAPVFRPHRMLAADGGGRIVIGFHLFPVGDVRALLRSDRGDLALHRPAVKIGVALGGGSLHHLAFDAHLAFQFAPKE